MNETLKFKLDHGKEISKNYLKNVIGNFKKYKIVNINKNNEVVYTQESIKKSNVVGLLQFGRSGTGLLHGLLDF